MAHREAPPVHDPRHDLAAAVRGVTMWVRSDFISDELVWRMEQTDRRNGQAWNLIDQRVTSSRGWWSSFNFDDAGAHITYSPCQQGLSLLRTPRSNPSPSSGSSSTMAAPPMSIEEPS